MALQYTMPQQLTLIGAASRRRIYRAVQLHYNTPPITPYIENTILPALLYLTERAANQRDIPQQFNAARWAVQHTHGENDTLAAAQFNYCGIAPDYDEIPMQGTSIQRITPDSEGVHIEIGNPHNLQTRFVAGISAIDLMLNNCICNLEQIQPAAQMKQRQDNAYNKQYKATLEKVKRLPQGENRYTTKQLAGVGLEGKTLHSALDKGFVIRVGWGKYEFCAALWNEARQ